MDDISQVKRVIQDVIQEIQWFKSENWDEEKSNPSAYSRSLEELYIKKIKAELALRRFELNAKS
jgi:AAA15 family ATPase/GTPase